MSGSTGRSSLRADAAYCAVVAVCVAAEVAALTAWQGVALRRPA